MVKVTQAIEDYLKAIYQVTEEQRRDATVQELARRLGVAKPSVSNMLKRLSGLGLVEAEPVHGATLTSTGRGIALDVVRHHRLVEMFLVDALGMPLDRIHAEAEILEHHISDEVEARIDRHLGHPRFDPHGHPIPDLDGNVPEVGLRSLASVPSGASGVVQRVSDGRPQVLRYLADIGVVPYRTVHVRSRAPFDGPLMIVTEDGELHALSDDIARLVDVAA